MTLSASAPSASTLRRFDAVERVLVILLYGWLVWRFASMLQEKPANALYLVSEGLVAVMLLMRRATDQISLRPADWLIGFAGTVLPLLAQPVHGGWAGGIVLMLGGLVVSVGAKLSLRRSFGIVAANRGVKRDGLYGAVRHPMYLGYLITYVGMLALNPSFWNLALMAAWMACQVYRIHAEERVLMQDDAYRAHAGVVRYRLIPLVY